MALAISLAAWLICGKMPFGCGGKPAVNENRMNKELSDFATRLRGIISSSVAAEVTRLKYSESFGGISTPIRLEPPHVGCYKDFDALARELFALQFKYNPAYAKICRARMVTPERVGHWTQIPAVPTAAFKELELTCLPPDERTVVFHSSGTTKQTPSRHYHCQESLKIYETSLWSWFEQNILSDLRFTIHDLRLICLLPPPELAPHSSLVHMFETVRQELGAPESAFVGQIDSNGAWTLDFSAAIDALAPSAVRSRSSRGNEAQIETGDEVRASLRRLLPPQRVTKPVLLLGTAFSFVHLLDFLTEKNLHFNLPTGSRVMETGGYKNRSRSMPKTELHALITERLGVPPENIICEYGMSELSSQAYVPGAPASSRRISAGKTTELAGWKPALPGRFRFPPWARAQIVSPETGQEVADGETGLIRVLDLANVFSVMAIQTEDLGIRRGGGFELIGRARLAEPRGCSLMMNDPLAPSLSPPGEERVAEGRVRG